MSSDLTYHELKTILEGLHMYEENMNEGEMRNCYDAIVSSKNTAKIENEHRVAEDMDVSIPESPNNAELDEDKTMSVDEMETMCTSNNQNGHHIETIRDPLNCKPSKYIPDIVKNPPLYKPPLYHTPEFEQLPLETKVRMLSEFHRQMLKTFADAHKKSNIFARMGTPILCKHEDWNGNQSLINSEPTEDTYVSRFGRQTKRKDYSESDAYGTYANKTPIKCTKKPKNSESTPTSAKQTITNDEIMKRSRFFNDTNTTPTSSPFSKLIDKKRVDEPPQSPVITESNKPQRDVSPPKNQNQSDDDDCEVFDKEPFLRRRVPPPLRGRKAIGSKRSGLNAFKSSRKPTLEVFPTSSNSSPSSSNESSKAKKVIGNTMCPICSEVFKADEVEAHAANCGLGMTNPVTIGPTTNDSLPKLQCSICDKEMALTTDYEIHVIECMRK